MRLNNLVLVDRYQVDSCHILLLPIYIKIGTLPWKVEYLERFYTINISCKENLSRT
jgi:hypothetical protein